MIDKVSLPLDEVLEDAPQTRCLLKLFESDSAKVGNYMQSMQTVLDRLVSAQNEMTAAVAALGSLLCSYKEQDFPLEQESTTYGPVVEKFQCTVTELSSWMEIISQQIQNCALYPVDKFLREMNELNGRKNVFHSIAEELDLAIAAEIRLRKSKKPMRNCVQSGGNSIWCFKAGLHYYVSMNNLQYSRRISLLEPVLSVIYAFRSFCHVGQQALSNDKDLVDFFTRTQEQLQSLHIEHETETKTYNQLVKTVNEIERLNPAVYNVENELPAVGRGQQEVGKINECHQKQGYLFMKNKSGLLTKWDRLYFFIQAGNLMLQTRDELAGKALLELSPGVKATVNDSEDRRHTFSVTIYNTKHQLIFQAQSDNERNEWITVLNSAANEMDRESISPLNSQFSDAKPDSQGKCKVTAVEDRSKDTCDIDLPIQFDLLTALDEDGFSSIFSPERQAVIDKAFQQTSLLNPGTWHEIIREFIFLGSLEVAADRNDKIIHEAVKKILETRSNHQITRSLDVNFVVQSSASPTPHLFLVEQKDQRPVNLLASFRLDDLALWLRNSSEPRFVAIVIRTKRGRADGRHKFTCYLFDAMDAAVAEKICHKLTESTRSAFQAMVSSVKSQKSNSNETVGQQESYDKGINNDPDEMKLLREQNLVGSENVEEIDAAVIGKETPEENVNSSINHTEDSNVQQEAKE